MRVLIGGRTADTIAYDDLIARGESPSDAVAAAGASQITISATARLVAIGRAHKTLITEIR